MVYFVNELYFNGQKYQTNVTVRDEIYEGSLLFPMKYFLSFITYRQSMSLFQSYY